MIDNVDFNRKICIIYYNTLINIVKAFNLDNWNTINHGMLIEKIINDLLLLLLLS